MATSVMYKIIFLVILILIMVLFTWISTRKYKKQLAAVETEKERVLLAKASSYQTTFILLVVYLFGNWIFSLSTGLQWGDIYTVCFTGFLLAMLSFVFMAVKRNAYDMLKDLAEYTAFFVAIALVGVLNLGLAIINIIYNANYLLIYEDTVTYLSYNFELGVALVLLAVVLKLIVGPKKREEEKKAEEAEVKEA